MSWLDRWNHESVEDLANRQREQELDRVPYNRLTSDANAWMADFRGVQLERQRNAARIAAIVAGAETDPIEIGDLELLDHPDYASFNIVEDWN